MVQISPHWIETDQITNFLFHFIVLLRLYCGYISFILFLFQTGQPDIATFKSQTAQPDLMPEMEAKQTSSHFDLVQDQGAEGTGWDEDDWFDNPVIEQSESKPEPVESAAQVDKPSSSGESLIALHTYFDSLISLLFPTKLFLNNKIVFMSTIL